MRSIIHRTTLAIAILVCATTARAQQLKFEHITIEDGLSQGSVECILQDRRGFMWFATRDGLNRYDGTRIVVFKHDRGDTTSISNNFTRRMVEDADGAIWIATKDGLNRFDPETEQFTRFYNDPADSTTLSSSNIMRVFLDRTGTLWVGTWGGGLNAYDRGRGTFRRFAAELHDGEIARGNIVNAIAEDRAGTLWVGAITGLYSTGPDRRAFTRHDLAGGVYTGARDNIVTCITQDARGTLWLGTYTGLVAVDAQTGTHKRYPLDATDPTNIAANQVRFVVTGEDAKTLWVCTASQGLAVFDIDSESFTFYRNDAQNPRAIGHNSHWFLCRDRGGTVWIGSDGRGVDKLSPMSRRFTHVAATPGRNSLADNSVWSFCVDRTGALWVGTGRGVSVLSPETQQWTAITHDARNRNSISDGAIYSILEDRRGDVWFATGSEGLSRATRRGDGGFDFARFKNVPGDPNSLSADRLFALYEDRAGAIWIGTVDEGVDRYDPDTSRFAHFRPDRDDPTSISDNGVDCIVEGADGALWIATSDGFNRLSPDRATFTRYFEADGLPNNYVYGIIPDDSGRLWLSTNGGVAVFDPNNETFRAFTTRDGLQSNEFNAGAYYRSPQGEIFLGGHNGFNRFFPASITRNPHAPPVVLTAFHVLGKPAEIDRAIYATPRVSLTHSDYFFSFEFAALDYWAPDANRYAYKMDGLDTDWIEAGTRNFVTYTNLDPGRYTFRVRAANSDGVWNEDGAAIAIAIAPPFWETWWFITLLSAMVLLAAYGFHRYRLRRLLEIERLRARISADLHDEIASNLSSIAMFSGLIEQDEQAPSGGQARQMLTRVRELAEESVGSIRDIVWAINPRPETLHSLLQRLRDRLVAAGKARGINVTVTMPDAAALPSHNLSPEVRQHLWMLLKEAVNNALKHSECTRLWFEVALASGHLQVAIRDNGRGFDPAQTTEGNGLATMKMRAEQLRGTLDVDTGVGGTTVRVAARVQQ